MRRDGAIFAIGAIGLGLAGLAFGDFALQWQPVPQEIPFRHALALVSAGFLLAAGAALLWRRSVRAGALALAVMYALWSILLKGHHLLDRPLAVVSWLGVAETLAMAAGGLTLAALTMQPGPLESRLRLTARLVFGVCAVIFGVSHFAYIAITADMVPDWMPPGGLFWARATGIAHLAAGLALLSGVQARLAAGLLALMCGLIALLLHAPAAFAAPTVHANWVMLAIDVSLCGAAWAIRAGADPKAPSWGFFGRKS